MQRQTTISIWCDRVIEAGWLIAIALIPIYFNLFSARHFEPDKATALRAIVLLMAAMGLIKLMESIGGGDGPDRGRGGGDAPAAAPGPHLARRFANIPLALPALLYALVFVFTTFTSIVPLTSFWGSYQRMQGTYTNLSYILLFALIVANMRRREQLERLVSVTLATGLLVASYGVVQHLGLDPLPWAGDVIIRVASTMGNSIFVAAYMIMIIPFTLYRLIAAASEVRQAPRPARASTDLLRALAGCVLMLASLGFWLAAVKFGAVVRTSDFRYWWVLPGATLASLAMWVLPTLPAGRGNDRSGAALWPGMVVGVFVLIWLLSFGISGSAQVVDERITRGLDWWLWLMGGVAGLLIYYGMVFVLPPRPATPSRLARLLDALGALLVLVVLCVATFFTQSRGPWIGLGTGLFVFVLFLLWQATRRARAREDLALAGRLRLVLGVWVGLTLLAGGFLIVFNLSDAPIFKQLRDVPYLGRMGRLLEVDTGTGLVRRLIWSGDEHGRGAIGLISADPLRTVIGWGPESMFVAFNRFYPPALANIESRGASPDRSHQAILDELVTKGVLGLASYLFLILSFVALCWRLIRHSDEWRWQVFFIACLSAVAANVTEGLTGIPIVSTLMMLWVTLAITVVGGMLAGQYSLGLAPAPAPANPAPPAPEPAEARKPGAQPAPRRAGGRGAAARGAAAARRPAARRASRPATNPAALALYAAVLALTLGGVWWFNLNPIYADMRFQEGQSYAEQPGAGINGLILGMEDYLATIRGNPREDFYYLNLGRTLMTIADSRRAQGVPNGAPDPNARVEDLLRLHDREQVQSFVQSTAPMAMMSYAEVVLQRARELNSMNKDHYANLGRLNNFWYSWTQDPARLQESVKWYQQVTEIAPQDVMLLNERASVTALLGKYYERQGDAAGAQEHFARAEQLLQRSKTLDARYPDTDSRMADLYRLQGRLAEAVDLYIGIVQRSPHQLDNSIERISDDLRDQPELLRKLRDAYLAQAADDALLHAIAGLLSIRAGDTDQALQAYERATALDPGSIEYHRNFTLVLSDTRQYARAVTEAQNALSLARGQQGREREVAQLEALVAFLQQKAAGGQ